MYRLPLLVLLACAAPTGVDASYETQESAPEPAATSEARPQDPDPLPDGVAALVGGDLLITTEEYCAYLMRIVGRKPLEDLIYTRLLERRAAELGIEVDRAAFEAAARESWDNMVEVRHRGDETEMLRELEQNGFDRGSFLANMAETQRKEQLEERIALAERQATDELLRERFDQDFGKDGLRTEIRHVLVTKAREKARRIAAGEPVATLTGPRLEEATAARAAELLERLRAGEDFAQLAKNESDDLSAKQTGGVIVNYNYLRYGERFAEATRAAEVGVLTGPVATDAGLHLIEVTGRTQTDFQDVRDELVQRVLSAPVSPKERFQLRQSLFQGVEVRTF